MLQGVIGNKSFILITGSGYRVGTESKNETEMPLNNVIVIARTFVFISVPESFSRIIEQKKKKKKNKAINNTTHVGRKLLKLGTTTLYLRKIKT